MKRDAAKDADRQRALDDVCQRVLGSFVGRKITPTAVAEAEGALRHALDDAIRAGKYVLPDGLALDHVELGDNMRLQVYFRKVGPVDLLPSLFPNLYAPAAEPAEAKMKDRFEAVAAEISNREKEKP